MKELSFGERLAINGPQRCNVIVCKTDVLGQVSAVGVGDEDVAMTYHDVLLELDGKPFADQFDLAHLSPSQRLELLQVFEAHKEVFMTSGKQLGL